MKRVITISRKWHSPHITTVVTDESISLSIDLEDFVKALIKEIGSVALVFTGKSFEKKLKKAVENVIEGVKEESVKVI